MSKGCNGGNKWISLYNSNIYSIMKYCQGHNLGKGKNQPQKQNVVDVYSKSSNKINNL